MVCCSSVPTCYPQLWTAPYFEHSWMVNRLNGWGHPSSYPSPRPTPQFEKKNNLVHLSLMQRRHH